MVTQAAVAKEKRHLDDQIMMHLLFQTTHSSTALFDSIVTNKVPQADEPQVDG